tara:strand:- start:1891 stop:2562 length:672 start_codon:yes stop_codon:yes gene_type:complete
MTTSGSTDFELAVDDYIEEAFERCGLEVRTGYDLRTAKRSLNLLFADWANRGLNRWTITQTSITLSQGTTEYTLAADTIDILSAVIRENAGSSNQLDVTVNRIGRDTYLNLSSKLSQGKPTQYYVDRQITPKFRVFPTPNATYTLVVDRLTRIEDADSATDTVDVPFRFYPCLAAGLAYYLAIKKAPDRIQILKAIYDEEFDRAATEDRDRTSLKLLPYERYI